jgi:hypothetical protein
MHGLQFKRIRICSEAEQKAFQQEFHPRKTLFLGDNSTGKSTIVKSLFRAFDAEPTGDLRGWDYGAIVAVDFSAQERQYTVVRKGDLRALFEGRDLVGVTTSSTVWNEIFARSVGFKLQLMDREEDFRTASPSLFFMPFYVNQDGSFLSAWDTFKSVKQFDANAIPHTLEYFAAVRPVRYFDLKGTERANKGKLAELEVEATTLQRTRARLKRVLRPSAVKLTSAGFEKEVHELARMATDLGSKQEKLRRDIVEAEEIASQLADQIRLSDAALHEHDADFRSVDTATSQGVFRCPTCHAEHDASFHTFLGLAEDARELYRMKEALQRNLLSVKERSTHLRRQASALKQQYLEVSNILSVKRGRLTFEDVVKSYGANATDTALDGEITSVNRSITACQEQLRDLKLEIERLMKTHDSGTPLTRFRLSFKDLLAVADVPEFPNVDLWKLSKRPTDSGSVGPRAVVAYYAALWSAMQDPNGNLPSPLVIDSPNQNAQDRENLKRVMALLAGRTPRNAQVILCAEEENDAFNADRVVFLEDKRNLLKRDAMNSVANDLLPMIERAVAELARVDQEPAPSGSDLLL